MFASWQPASLARLPTGVMNAGGFGVCKKPQNSKAATAVERVSKCEGFQIATSDAIEADVLTALPLEPMRAP